MLHVSQTELIFFNVRYYVLYLCKLIVILLFSTWIVIIVDTTPKLTCFKRVVLGMLEQCSFLVNPLMAQHARYKPCM